MHAAVVHVRAAIGWLLSFSFAEPMTAGATTGHWIFSGQVTAALRRMSQVGRR